MRKLLAMLGSCIAAAHLSSAAAEQTTCRVQDPELTAIYQGGCKDGLAEGYGEAQGIAQYRGEFHAGRKYGKGIKTWRDGDSYDGQFVDDRTQGYGTYIWGSGAHAGERYTGEFLKDHRNGFGTYTWPDGEVYRGQWSNDRIIGNATASMLQRARILSRAQMESMATVVVPGTVVCRQISVGISDQDWIRGVIVATSSDHVSVKITDPGRFPFTLNGAEIAKNTIVQGNVSAWTLCFQ